MQFVAGASHVCGPHVTPVVAQLSQLAVHPEASHVINPDLPQFSQLLTQLLTQLVSLHVIIVSVDAAQFAQSSVGHAGHVGHAGQFAMQLSSLQSTSVAPQPAQVLGGHCVGGGHEGHFDTHPKFVHVTSASPQLEQSSAGHVDVHPLPVHVVLGSAEHPAQVCAGQLAQQCVLSHATGSPAVHWVQSFAGHAGHVVLLVAYMYPRIMTATDSATTTATRTFILLVLLFGSPNYFSVLSQ